MERIWKLAVYIFWIVMSTALILVAYVLSGNNYHAFAVIMVYGGLFGLMIGIFGGIYTIVTNRTVPKETSGDEQQE